MKQSLDRQAAPHMPVASDEERMETVWRQRAKWLSRRPDTIGAGRDALPVIVLCIGDERYGIELAAVAEVLPRVRLTRVPGAPLHVSGVINVHGEIRPVANLRRLLGLEALEKGDFARVILLRMQGREMGLEVDGVEQVRWIASGELRSADERQTDLAARFLKGWTEDTLMVLNIEKLFAEFLKGSKG